MDIVETRTESWQVETGGQVFDTDLDEMTAWISEGSLLRIDRVRKNNLRWIEAGKVPQLLEFFNAKDAGETIARVVTTTHGAIPSAPEPNCAGPGISKGDSGTLDLSPSLTVGPAQGDACAMHPDVAAAWACDTCSNLFCKTCPSGYGATVKICPFCGAMCRSLAEAVVQAKVYELNVRAFAAEGFGFSDFGNALAYPFKFKFSLIVGAVMFAAFSIGSGAGGFGGIFAMVGGIACLLCSNMLSFGVLANTVESFSQGKLDLNFMPAFEDFSIWDDVVHPFFLSIGVYITSFGPLIAIVVVAAFMVVGSVKNEMNGFQDDAARAVDPELPYAAKAVNQSQAVRDMLDRTKDYQQRRVEQLNKDAIEPDQMPDPVGSADPEQQDFDRTNRMIQEQQKAQLESVVGKTPETRAKDKAAFVKQVLGYGVLFITLGAICLLWGLFYFPAACAVAGYTRSFAATLNPTVGLDTIKRLGGSYVKILLMGIVLLLVSTVVSGVLGSVFSAFDLPGLGNVPAKFLGSMFGFYVSVVFSCVLGYALFKNADRLALPSQKSAPT